MLRSVAVTVTTLATLLLAAASSPSPSFSQSKMRQNARTPTYYGLYGSSEHQSNLESTLFYFSNDEQEERILSALARAHENIDDAESQSFTNKDPTKTKWDYISSRVLRRKHKSEIKKSRKINHDQMLQEHSNCDRNANQNQTLLLFGPKNQEHHSAVVNITVNCQTESATSQLSKPTSFVIIENTNTLQQQLPLTSPVPPSIQATTSPWVRDFLATCSSDVLLPVPMDYLLDNFNLAQLAPVIEYIGKEAVKEDNENSTASMIATETGSIYEQALQLIVQDNSVPQNPPLYLTRAAVALYLLVHQRFVLSPRGLDMVRRRFLFKSPVDPIFGQCPCLSCNGMPLLPFGDSEDYCFPVAGGSASPSSRNARAISHSCRAKRYCCSCGQVFYHWDSKVDGCAWGPSFCHLFLMTCGDDVLGQLTVETKSSTLQAYNRNNCTISPRIFGFRLHPSVEHQCVGRTWNDLE